MIKVKTTGGCMSSSLISFSPLHSRERGTKEKSPQPASNDADPHVFILRTRIKRFNRERVGRRGLAGSVNEEGMKILN